LRRLNKEEARQASPRPSPKEREKEKKVRIEIESWFWEELAFFSFIV